jgi:TRAP-type uncharacterized transport system substrate-binding protein
MELKPTYLMRIGIVVLMLAVLSGCDELDSEMRLLPPAYQNVDQDALQEIFAERSGIDLTAAAPGTRMSALDALTNDVADLALVENSASFTPGVRAVLPVYQSVLHVIARKNFEPRDASVPLKGVTIYIADNSGASHRVLEVVAKRQGLTLDQLKFVDSPEGGNVDFILYFGPINPDNPSWYRPGYELVSLAKRLNPEREFDRDGVGYIIPKMHAAIIPALTYDIPGNEEPIVTVAADTLLVARSNVPVRLIYELTKTLIEQKPRFTAIAPHLFGDINDSFDPLELSFPLHAGARFYLHRDEPGLLERYAETINLLVYIVFLLLSAGVAFARWRLHRKKDRIDTFYVRALGIQEQATAGNTEELLAQLSALEQEAFKSLIDEKLSANESFRIFTDLLLRVRTDLLAKKEN